MGAWIDSIVPEDSDFTIDNLPWGVYKTNETNARICVAIGTYIVDMYDWASNWQDNKGYGEEFGYRVKEALMEVQFLLVVCNVYRLIMGIWCNS